MRRRRLIIVIVGIVFLGLMGWAGSILPDLLPGLLPIKASAQTQTTQAGPYQVTLSVDPDPPLVTRPATLTVQITRRGTQQTINNARVVLESTMETMDMGTDQTGAQQQASGVYRAQVQFSMSGPWQVRVLISAPGAAPEHASFEITAR